MIVSVSADALAARHSAKAVYFDRLPDRALGASREAQLLTYARAPSGLRSRQVSKLGSKVREDAQLGVDHSAKAWAVAAATDPAEARELLPRG